MEDNSDDLAALIASRICHDLSNPVGAVVNGMELLSLSGTAQGAEMDLIADSAGQASAQIQFFRIAYGAPGEQVMAASEIAAILDRIGAAARVQTVWAPGQPLPRSLVRLAFLAVQCCETALPHGGRIRVDERGGAWTVEARAETLSYDADLWGGLQGGGPAAGLSPARVQFALLPAAAAGLGRSVTAEQTGDRITLRY